MSSERIELVARFSGRALREIDCMPLSDDQRFEPLSGGEVRVRATVEDTEELRRLLLGYGSEVIVEGPGELRSFMARTWRAMYDLYHGRGKGT